MKVEIIFEDEMAACEMVKIGLDVRQKATAGLIREAAKMGSLSALFMLHLYNVKHIWGKLKTWTHGLYSLCLCVPRTTTV